MANFVPPRSCIWHLDNSELTEVLGSSIQFYTQHQAGMCSIVRPHLGWKTMRTKTRPIFSQSHCKDIHRYHTTLLCQISICDPSLTRRVPSVLYIRSKWCISIGPNRCSPTAWLYSTATWQCRMESGRCTLHRTGVCPLYDEMTYIHYMYVSTSPPPAALSHPVSWNFHSATWNRSTINSIRTNTCFFSKTAQSACFERNVQSSNGVSLSKKVSAASPPPPPTQ